MVDKTRRNAETQKRDRRLGPGVPVIGNRLPARRETINPRLGDIWQVLATVTDPEIPALSVVDMGIIADVRIAETGVLVELTPTFVGCPAIDVIRQSIVLALQDAGEANAVVNIIFDPPWTSDRITAAGRENLRRFGLAPPSSSPCTGELTEPATVACPFCGSMQTDLESLFGPTLCRSIHYCRACLQSFEHFKAI